MSQLGTHDRKKVRGRGQKPPIGREEGRKEGLLEVARREAKDSSGRERGKGDGVASERTRKGLGEADRKGEKTRPAIGSTRGGAHRGLISTEDCACVEKGAQSRPLQESNGGAHRASGKRRQRGEREPTYVPLDAFSRSSSRRRRDGRAAACPSAVAEVVVRERLPVSWQRPVPATR